MDDIFHFFEGVSVICWRMIFVAAMVFALFMAVIPGKYDPTRFINDKVRHALAFMVLSFLVDFAFPSSSELWYKLGGLMVFGVFIELCQQLTRYRRFSVGDILANGVGVFLYLLLNAVFVV